MADECECSLHVRLVGDGCAACNPALALEHANARIAELEKALRLLVDACHEPEDDSDPESPVYVARQALGL